MSKFQVGDEVVIRQLTTPGCAEFQDWARRHLKNQTPLIVTNNTEEGDIFLYFKEVGWCLYLSDVEKYQPIMENE